MIDPRILRRAVTLGGPKEAALFFDTVFPVDVSRPALNAFGLPGGGGGDVGLHIPFDPERGWDLAVLQSLMREDDVKEYISLSFLAFAMHVLFGMRNEPAGLVDAAKLLEAFSQKIPNSRLCTELFREVASSKITPLEAFDKILPLMHETMENVGFHESSVWYADPDYVGRKKKKDKSAEPFCLAIQGLQLVDVSNMSWEAIVEFRKDKSSMKSLRDFRLFLTETFNRDEDPEYIRDKLLSLHDKQLEESRKWGFATVTKTLSAVMDQATMFGTALASVPLALAGGPLAVTGAVVVPLGKFALELAKVKAEADEKLASSPVRYLSKVADLG